MNKAEAEMNNRARKAIEKIVRGVGSIKIGALRYNIHNAYLVSDRLIDIAVQNLIDVGKIHSEYEGGTQNLTWTGGKEKDGDD